MGTCLTDTSVVTLFSNQLPLICSKLLTVLVTGSGLSQCRRGKRRNQATAKGKPGPPRRS